MLTGKVAELEAKLVRRERQLNDTADKLHELMHPEGGGGGGGGGPPVQHAI